jgi:glutathione S-transferase
MKLYHCKNARSFRVLWTLEALDLDYQLINLDFPPRIKNPEFLLINPLGTVPAFIDSVNESITHENDHSNKHEITLTESTAICQYIVDKYDANTDKNTDNPLGLSPSHPEYGEYLNWLHRSDATFTFPQAILLRYQRYETAERLQPQVANDYEKWFHNRIRTVEATLENKDYLCANRFTIADICVGYALYLALSIGISERLGPNTKAYLERLMQLDSFKRATEKQKHLDEIF